MQLFKKLKKKKDEKDEKYLFVFMGFLVIAGLVAIQDATSEIWAANNTTVFLNDTFLLNNTGSTTQVVLVNADHSMNLRKNSEASAAPLKVTGFTGSQDLNYLQIWEIYPGDASPSYVNHIGQIYEQGQRVCTQANGLCLVIANVTSSGSSGYITQFQNSTGINNSIIYQNGSNIGIGTTTPSAQLEIDAGIGQSSDVFQVNNANGEKVFTIDAVGNIQMWQPSSGPITFVLDAPADDGLPASSNIVNFTSSPTKNSNNLSFTSAGKLQSNIMQYNSRYEASGSCSGLPTCYRPNCGAKACGAGCFASFVGCGFGQRRCLGSCNYGDQSTCESFGCTWNAGSIVNQTTLLYSDSDTNTSIYTDSSTNSSLQSQNDGSFHIYNNNGISSSDSELTDAGRWITPAGFGTTGTGFLATDTTVNGGAFTGTSFTGDTLTTSGGIWHCDDTACYWDDGNAGWWVDTGGVYMDQILSYGYTPYLLIDQDVGLGVAPTQKLEVLGTIKSSESSGITNELLGPDDQEYTIQAGASQPLGIGGSYIRFGTSGQPYYMDTNFFGPWNPNGADLGSAANNERWGAIYATWNITTSNGRIGVGTETPTTGIEVKGTPNSNGHNIEINSTGAYGGFGILESGSLRAEYSYGDDGNIFNTALPNSLGIRSEYAMHLGANLSNGASFNYEPAMTINGRRIGILTTQPTQALDVNGSVNVTSELQVGGISGDGAGKVVCIKSGGNLGTCSDAINATGYCTCG